MTRIGSSKPRRPTPVRATNSVPTPDGGGVVTVIRVNGTVAVCRSQAVIRRHASPAPSPHSRTTA